MENAAKEYALFMKEIGWNVTIITNRYPKNLPKNDNLEGLSIKRLFFFHSPLQYLKSLRIDLLLAWLFLKPITLIKLVILFFRYRPVIVNLHFPDHQLFECLILKFIFKFKLVISLHGDEVRRVKGLRKKSLRFILYNYLFKSSNFITGCSNHLLTQHLLNFKEHHNKSLITINNGVNNNFIDQTLNEEKKNYVFTASRFVPDKGLDLLVEAFNQIDSIDLHIAGGDKHDLNQLGLKTLNNVIILGILGQDSIAKRLVETKLTVIPSREETYGIFIAEALCSGSPIVTTNVGGIPEVISIARDQLTVKEKIVFDCWVKVVEPDSHSISNGIVTILNNNNSYKEYINLVFGFRERYRWSNQLDNFNKAINQLKK